MRKLILKDHNLIIPDEFKEKVIFMIAESEDHYEEYEKALNSSSLVIIKVNSWNDELSPWPLKFKPFDFKGDADTFVTFITDEVIPYIKKYTDATYGIIGYSLAGLFSLYASTKTDIFDTCASVSGSLWYPQFVEYLKEHPLKAQHIYLSLGDKEAHSKHQLMKMVAECTNEIHEMYPSSFFEWNEGNHFNDPQGRLIKALKKMD